MLVGPPLLNNNNTVDDDYLSRRWVLLVDDEEPIRQAVGQLLTNQGYHVTACADGRAALQELPQPPNASPPGGRLPDVIVSDVRLPGDSLDGLGLLRAVRASVAWRSVPVVLLTARGAPLDRVAGYRAGADAYLPKPFDPDELIALLERVVQRREQLLSGSSIRSGTSSSSTSSNNSSPGRSGTSSSAIVDDMKRSVQEIQRLLLLDQQGGNNNNNNNGASAVFLAPPERQVLQLLCQGLRNKEIAERTFLSTRRVEQVLTTLYRKTNVKNRTELVRWAIVTGHVQL